MQILVDADACPRVIKEILYRAAERVRVSLILIANRGLWTPRSEYIRTVQVPQGFDVADREIVERVEKGDLVICSDIPLAVAVIARGAQVLSPRGERYTEENIGEYSALRNFMDELRSGGVVTGGPPAFAQGDRQAFSNQLNRILLPLTKKSPDSLSSG